MSRLVLITLLAAVAYVCDGSGFVATPSGIEMCGSGQSTSLRLTCSPHTPGVTAVYAIEIGKIVRGDKAPISRVTVLHSSPLTVDNILVPRLSASGSISGSSGSLRLTLNNLVEEDATTYYCHTSILTNVLMEENATKNVELRTLAGSVPDCQGSNVMSAVSAHKPVTNANSGKCPNGLTARSEALLLNFCSAPTIANWGQGRKVLDICCQIPLYTPVATFEFGMYVQDERGNSGIFLGCTNDGFHMATQLCGHYPINVTVRTGASSYISNGDNYYVVTYSGSAPFGRR